MLRLCSRKLWILIDFQISKLSKFEFENFQIFKMLNSIFTNFQIRKINWNPPLNLSIEIITFTTLFIALLHVITPVYLNRVKIDWKYIEYVVRFQKCVWCSFDIYVFPSSFYKNGEDIHIYKITIVRSSPRQIYGYLTIHIIITTLSWLPFF